MLILPKINVKKLIYCYPIECNLRMAIYEKSKKISLLWACLTKSY